MIRKDFNESSSDYEDTAVENPHFDRSEKNRSPVSFSEILGMLDYKVF